MYNFVVGDIQGCYKALKQGLKKAGFDAKRDKLWAVGDLIARGPDSLSTLDFCRDLGPHFDTVLGNHDLHLIAIAHGLRKPKAQDKLDSLIRAKHFDRLIDFLINKPLALKPARKTLITHAGLYPAWSIKQALQLSQEIEQQLQGKKAAELLKNMYGNEPTVWSDKLEGHSRNRFIINAFTRMRFLNKKHALDFDAKSHPSQAPSSLYPWFMFDNPKLKPEHRLLFGHWAALLGTVSQEKFCKAQIHALDTGYVWGNALSFYCLETQKTIQYKA